MPDKIIGRVTGGIAEIIFNNPAKLNATSLDMWQRAGELAQQYAVDPEVRVLVLSGAGGKAFVSGADISKFESQRASTEANEVYSKASLGAYEGVYNFPKPTIAKIHGYCIGGGMNLAACCDLRVATTNSKFGVPAGRLGLGYGYTPINRLSHIVGLSRAMQFLYTAQQIGAEEAYGIGLLNKVVPEADIDTAVAELASAIAENAPLTIALVKASALEITRPDGVPDHAKLKRMSDACFSSADFKEGRTAFMEKRKPKFQGK
jgi:enoyl-CoA hydratase